MNKIFDFIKNFKLVDLIILAGIVIALIVGYLTFKNYRQTAAKQIEATSKISFQVYIRGVTLTGGYIPLNANDTTFISIRNVPYSDLKVLDVKADRKKTVLSSINSKNPIIVDDASQAYMYDIIVTLTDTAKITKDGAVVGGNKIKMGLPITLEGQSYKFNGTVSDIKVMPSGEDSNLQSTVDVNDNV